MESVEELQRGVRVFRAEAASDAADAVAARDRLKETVAALNDVYDQVVTAPPGRLPPAAVVIVETMIGPTVRLATITEQVAEAAASVVAAGNAAQTGVVDVQVAAQGDGAAGDIYVARHGATEQAAQADQPAPARPKNPDPARVGKRLMLLDGEEFIASVKVPSDADLDLVAAAVETPEGVKVHVGLLPDEYLSQWKGGHAPEAVEEPDEEDPDTTVKVDTWSDQTAVIDAADAARMPQDFAVIVERAEAVDREYKKLAKEWDKTDGKRRKLEREQYIDPVDAQAAEEQRGWERSKERWHKEWGESAEDIAAGLNPEDRAKYDAAQQKLDPDGTGRWNPDRQDEAAAACDLSPEEFQEAKETGGVKYTRRTRQQEERYEYLFPYRTDQWQPHLLEEQAALVCGLSIDELHEMKALERSARAHRSSGGTGMPEEDQKRLAELRTAPGGVTGKTPEETAELRDRFRDDQYHHHRAKMELLRYDEATADRQTRTKPLPPEKEAERQRLSAEADALGEQLDALGGTTSAAVEYPASNGGVLRLSAVQGEEEGGVDYRLDRVPEGADAGWTSDADFKFDKPSGMKKVVTKLSDLATTAAAAAQK